MNRDYPAGAFFKPGTGPTVRKGKETARKRDGDRYCRVVGPSCEYASRSHTTFHGAHIEDAGMGGDPRGIRSHANNIVRCCAAHHTGKWSLHSKHLRIEVLSVNPLRIRTWGRDRVPSGKWYVVHEEAA